MKNVCAKQRGALRLGGSQAVQRKYQEEIDKGFTEFEKIPDKPVEISVFLFKNFMTSFENPVMQDDVANYFRFEFKERKLIL